MEKYFRPAKSIGAARKRSGAQLSGSSKHSVHEGEAADDVSDDWSEDTLLKKTYTNNQRVICWRPRSRCNLHSKGVAYLPLHQVVTTVSLKNYRDAWGSWALWPVLLETRGITSLTSMIADDELEGLLFEFPQSHHDEEVPLELDFTKAMEYLKSFYETEIYFIEIKEHVTHTTSRFLLGSRLDPRLPALPSYNPQAPGGPWFRDSNGQHKFLQSVRSYRSPHRLPHGVQFFLCLTREQIGHLGQMCTEVRRNGNEEASLV